MNTHPGLAGGRYTWTTTPPRRPTPRASKWALRGLAKAACLELGPRGIRVNTVRPGYVETPMTASAIPAFRDANVAETPLGRTGPPTRSLRSCCF